MQTYSKRSASVDATKQTSMIVIADSVVEIKDLT